MEIEGYSVGSIAELVSGNATQNKPKVVKKEFKSVEPKILEKQKTKKSPPQELKADEFIPSDKKKKNKPFKVKHNKNYEPTSSTSFFKRKRKHSEVVESKESEPPKKKQNNISNGEKRIKTKENSEKEKSVGNRTVFVGNVPIQMSKLKLMRFFSKYGAVESVRVRGVPVADTRVPKKVAYIKKEFHPDRTSANCYVRFSSPEEAQKALALNGQLLKEHHLRVRLCNEDEKPDSSKAVFIGNVSFGAEEDEVWELFEPCGQIESVRLVRDSKTGIGKGFGYVNFESSDSVELAMQMEKFVLKGRELRVSICKANAKNKGKPGVAKNKEKREKKQRKTEQVVTQEQEASDNTVEQTKTAVKTKKHDFEGIKISENKKKKKKVNRGLLQKKRLVKKFLPNPKA